jgi:CheY-like chemotaxis protein
VVQVLTSHFAYVFPLAVTKTVLVAQGQPFQAQLWKLALESQQHRVVLISPRPDLAEVAATQCQPLDLMVVDITTGLFNPYAFCRECRSRLPAVPVILTHHPRRPIEPAERRWAISQGAAEMIPGLAEADDILPPLEQVYKAAGWPFPIDAQALYTALEQAGLGSGKPVSSLPEAAEERQEQKAETQPAKYRLMYRGSSIASAEEHQEQKAETQPAKYRLTYRGRPVE